MWSYTDVYHSFVDYVSQDLKDGTFKLNGNCSYCGVNTQSYRLIYFTKC